MLTRKRVFTSYPSPAFLPSKENEALTYLKDLPSGVVLSKSYKDSVNVVAIPKPFVQYGDTSYISAFSGKQTYFADTVQLDLLGIRYNNRKKMVLQEDCSIFPDIKYIYERTVDPMNNWIKKCSLKTKLLYKNSSVRIYSTIK